MWSTAGQALATAGESLYTDLQSIGNWFSGLFSIGQNTNGSETLNITNQSSANNWTNSLINITTNGNVPFGLINYNNGTSQSDYYDPSSGVSEAAFSYTGLNDTGTLTSEMVNLTDGTSQNYLYNPSSGESEQVWFYSGLSLSGTLEQVMYNYTNGTSQLALLGDLPANLASKGITSEIQSWSGANGTGTLGAWVDNYGSGQSTVSYPGTGSLQQQTFVYTGPNGTGTNTEIINYNTDGTSTWYYLTPPQNLTSQGVSEVIAKYAGVSPSTSPTQFAIFNYSSGKSHVQFYNPSAGVSELIQNYTGLTGTGTLMDSTAWLNNGTSQVTIEGAPHNLSGVTSVAENWSGQYGSGNNGQETSAVVNFSNGWKATFTYTYGNGGNTPTQVTQVLQTPNGAVLPGTTFGPGPSYPYISGASGYGYDGGGVAVLGIDEANFGGYGLVAGSSSKSAGIDVIAQYDQSHGFTAAAAQAEAARQQAAQLIAGAGASAGTPSPSPFEAAKWTDNVITWSFATGAGPSTAPFSGSISSQYQAVIEQAMQAWAKASGLTFEEVPASAASDIRIGWGSFDTTDSNVIGFTSGQSLGGQMQPGVIIRLENPAQTPLVAGAGGAPTYSGTGVELYQAALHEIGHALGLADNADPGSIMFAELGAANTALDLTDVANIRALYAPASSPTPTALLTKGGGSLSTSTPTLSGPLPIPALTYTAAPTASPPH